MTDLVESKIWTIEDGIGVIRLDRSVYDETVAVSAAHSISDEFAAKVETSVDELRIFVAPAIAVANVENGCTRFLRLLNDHTLRARLKTETAAIRNLLYAEAFSRISVIRPPASDPDEKIAG
jgi:His-Xaa-Ser system protein HxsD